MNDAVNHPGHYTSHPSGIECIQVTEHMSFCLGNAVKYIWRADLKGNAVEDLQKARWYVDREIARLGGQPAMLDQLAADGRLGLIAEPSPGCEWHSAREVTPPAVSVPDSGPDGTPEKPWKTADDIPADIEKVRDRVGKEWRRKSGGWCFMPGNSCGCVDGILDTHFAPFVRVDGGKA